MHADSIVMDQSVVVFCPLEIERKAIHATIHRAGLPGVQVRLMGLGARAAASAVRGLSKRPDLVILAGVCGGLVDVPHVVTAARVVDEQGQSWEPSAPAGDGVVIAGVDRPICSPQEKRALHDATGAAVVDMESHGFVRACEGWEEPHRPGGGPLRWAIVRGVSDHFDEPFPEQVARWVDAEGRTRTGRAAADLAMRPWLVPTLVRIMRRSGHVLPLVGGRVADLARSAATAAANS